MLFAQACERTFEGSPSKGSRSKGSNLVLCNNAELGPPAKPDRRSFGENDLQNYGGNAQIKTVVKKMRKIKVRKQTADFHKPAVSIKAFAMSKRPPMYTFSGTKVLLFIEICKSYPIPLPLQSLLGSNTV